MTKLVCSVLFLASALLILATIGVSGSMLPPGAQGAAQMAEVIPLRGSPSVVSSFSGDHLGHAGDHEDYERDEQLMRPDEAFLEQLAKSRASSPYLHELKEQHEALSESEETDELMTRVEGAATAAEIRKALDPYLHPAQHAQLQQEPPPPLVSQKEQRQLRTQHMKHVLEMKYAKMHAHSRSASEMAATLGKITSVANHTVAKSSEDDRSYRFITLANGLRAVLVSDPNTTKSAAAMDVGNGYLSDPREIPGLAHFLEHMLFLGTKKYPSESAYADFIESHGGFSNAYTAMENTNYYFDILPNHLIGALDRFAQFFIEPLLNVNTTEREMKAVDAEHSKNILSDNWRANRLLQDIANISHPYSKFGTGCAATLDVMPHEEMQGHLRKFWTQHYTANNLFLSIIGQESLDQLQAVVDEKFSGIRSSEEKYNPLAGTTPQDVWNSTILGSEVFVNTIEDTKWVSLMFPLESQYPKYKYQAVSYLRSFIESRGRNTLLKQLKQKGWATGVQLGIDAGTSQFATIQLSVDLTQSGSSHIDEIIAAFFSALKVVRKKGLEEWRFKEMQVISNLTFTYKDKEHPSDYISKLASNLRHYPPEDMLIGGKLFIEYSKKEIELVLDKIHPENMLVVLGGKNLNHEMRFKEKWYGIEYDVQKLAPKRMKYWKKSWKATKKNWKFSLAKKSTFLPTNLTVNPPLLNPVPRPIILFETPKNVTTGSKRLWYSEDLEFHRPHGHAVFRMYIPGIYATARNYLLTNIWVNLLEDQVDEDLYSALVAGFSSHFRVGTCYVDLIFYGYNQGLVNYGQQIARIMNPATGFKPNKQRFDLYKETLIQSYLNKKYEQPHRQSSILLSSLLDPKMVSNYDLVRTLELVTFEDVTAWPKVLFGDMSLEAYVHGNVVPDVAKTLLKIFVKELPFKTTSAAFNNVATRNHYLPRPRLGQVKEDVAVTMLASNPQETNSAIVKYWQYGMGGIEGKLYSQLLALIGQKPIFHQLRTQEQLGYIVWSSADNRLDVNGFKIQVQSGRRPAHYLSARIDAFLSTFQKRLLAMTQKQFEVYIETLMMSKLQSPVSMAVQTSWFWNEISKQEYVFQRKEIELYILNATQIINRAGFQAFVQKLFYISDVDNPGVQSCELRGGGVLSVRVESPVPQVAIVNNSTRRAKGGKAVVGGKKLIKAADALVKKHGKKGQKLAGGQGKQAAGKKKVATTPLTPQQKLKAEQERKRKAALVARRTKAKAKKPQAKPTQHKSLLSVASESTEGAEVEAETDSEAEAEAAAAAEVDAEAEAEAESESETENETEAETETEADSDADTDAESEQEDASLAEMDSDADSETESEFELDAETESEADAESDESVFFELSSSLSHNPTAASPHAEVHDHAHTPQLQGEHYDLPTKHAEHKEDVHGHAHAGETHAHSQADKPKKRALIRGAGPFVAAGKDAKDVSISALDQRIVVMTRARDGGMYVLNTTQSTLHIFTDSMMLYPRNRYEAPPKVTKWKNVKPVKKEGEDELAETDPKKKDMAAKAAKAAKAVKAKQAAARKQTLAQKKKQQAAAKKNVANKKTTAIKKTDRKKKPKSAKKKKQAPAKKA